ncbi:MAG: flagellar biosynthetic protein FliP [Chlamydiales bacterium]|nr:flagellar biosynthetic protein FliP [Chlamydiales bacterium]
MKLKPLAIFCASKWKYLLAALITILPILCWGQIHPDSPEKPTFIESIVLSPNPYEHLEYFNLHQQLKILGFLTLVTFIPFILVMMTSFTRLTIIFHFLRQALATQTVPSNQLVIGLSLILTGFIMHPVIEDIQDNALTPYLNNTMKETAEVRTGVKSEDQLLMERAWTPLKNFMVAHTREKDMMLFLDMSSTYMNKPKATGAEVGAIPPAPDGSQYRLEAVPWYIIVPSFVLSELRTAFMMGFLLFLPFLVIDMVIASVLMSMGMMMLPPALISMPFKLMLFILVDGWRLIVEQAVKGFHTMG